MILWDNASGVPIATLEGHSDFVKSLSFSPDGSRLASGSRDKTVRLWDGTSGVPIATLEGHSDSVESLLFSPDGSRLASGSRDTTVRLWDGASGVPITTLEGHSFFVVSLSFSPDGSKLASGSNDQTARLWDGSTGVLIAILTGHSYSVWSLSFSPNGSRLISGSYSSVSVWDGSTGVPIVIVEGHSDSVVSLTFSLDATRLASGLDNVVRFLDCSTLEGHPHFIYPLPRSPLVSQLASMSVDTILKLRDDDADGYFSSSNIKPDRHLSSEDLFMSPCEPEDPSGHYCIQGTVPGYGRVPFLWFPMDTAEILEKEFCKKVAAFGCRDGRVIILDLTQLNFQLETVTT